MATKKMSSSKKSDNSNKSRITSNIPSNKSTKKTWDLSESAGTKAWGKVVKSRSTGTGTIVNKDGSTAGSTNQFKTYKDEKKAYKDADSAGRKAQQKEMQKNLKKNKK